MSGVVVVGGQKEELCFGPQCFAHSLCVCVFVCMAHTMFSVTAIQPTQFPSKIVRSQLYLDFAPRQSDWLNGDTMYLKLLSTLSLLVQWSLWWSGPFDDTNWTTDTFPVPTSTNTEYVTFNCSHFVQIHTIFIELLLLATSKLRIYLAFFFFLSLIYSHVLIII